MRRKTVCYTMVAIACLIFINEAAKLGNLSDFKILTMSTIGCLILIIAIYMLSKPFDSSK